MCTLISRGEFLTLPLQPGDNASTPSVGSSTVQPPTISTLPPTTPVSRDDMLPPTVSNQFMHFDYLDLHRFFFLRCIFLRAWEIFRRDCFYLLNGRVLLSIRQSEFKAKIEELDDSNVDDDLDKILQNIKVDQQDLMDAPDSPVKIEPKAIVE